MKKLSIIVIAALSLGAAACTQEKSLVPSEQGQTAITASMASASTRSSLNVDGSAETPAYTILWDAPDKILAGYAGSLATFTSTNTTPVAEATFTGKLPEGSGTLYGIYPAARENTVDADGIFAISFKDDQQAVAGGYDKEAFPAVAESRSTNLSFQNICGLLALQVGYDDVTKISLTGEVVYDYAVPTRAAVFVPLPGGIFRVDTSSGEPEVVEFTHMLNSINLYAPSGGVFSQKEVYYMSVPPCVLVNGATFKLTRQSGETVSIIKRGPVSVERSKVHEVGTLYKEEEIIPDDPTDDNTINGHECVDLGLPSGNKWATCNIGASAPEEKGQCFPWAVYDIRESPVFDDDGYVWRQLLSWDVYKWVQMKGMDEGWNYITKYTFADGQTDGLWYSGDSFVGDGKTTLADYEYADDPARYHWGGTWRTPSQEDFEELIQNTDVVITPEWHALFTSKTDNTKSILIPLVVFEIGGASSSSDYYPYWTSGLSSSSSCNAVAFCPQISKDDQFVSGFRDLERAYYYPVRPVSE